MQIMQTKLSLDKIYQYMHIQIIISIIKTGCITLVLELVLNLPFFFICRHCWILLYNFTLINT